MRKRYYVGVNGSKGSVFLSANEPTELSHGNLYKYVIGPFQTKRGALYMALYGLNNPSCQTVASAERLARQEGHNAATLGALHNLLDMIGEG